MNLPTVVTGAGVLRVLLRLGEVSRSMACEAVLDTDDFGTLLGVEVLAFAAQLGTVPPPTPPTGPVTWSYDAEMDAFYLRLSPGTAPMQRKATARGLFDDRNQFVGLEVPLGGT